MESDVLVWVLGIVIPCIITTVIGLVLTRYFNKYFKKRDAEQEVREAQTRELQEYRAAEEKAQWEAIIEQGVTKATEPIRADLAVIKSGSQAALRHDLYAIYDAWAPKGWCPREVKADFENLYTSYHALGKNGVMDSCYDVIMALPDHESISRVAPKS